jgi:hypothetical protein
MNTRYEINQAGKIIASYRGIIFHSSKAINGFAAQGASDDCSG